ncbi:MAG: GAF domain-containing protein [candidate division Zixibacteria bacterium]|nr:GAF domain-containing protein [candidate division Zixibacteria bacterium]
MDDLLKNLSDKSNNINVASELKKFNIDIDKEDNEPDNSVNGGIGYDDLASLYDVSQAVNSTLILDDILSIVMTRSIKLLNAERGFLMMLDDYGKLQFKTAHNIKKEQLDSKDMKISTTIADMVVKTGKAVYTSDAQIDDRFSQKASIIDLNIRSAMCVPLKIKKKVIGVVYLDNSSQANIFLKQDLALFEMFAAQAATAIHNAGLFTEVLELQKYQQHIFANTPVGILVINTEGKVTTVNETTGKIFSKIGWTDFSLNENGMSEMALADVIPGKYCRNFTQSIIKAKHAPVELPRLSVDSNGEEYVLKTKFCPFENYHGKSAGHIILIEDITEQVVMEQYLILSEKFIAKGEMAAAIGHELNNYLTAISTNAQLLGMNLEKGSYTNIPGKVDVIMENVDHIKRFTDGLMDFSSLESKPVPYDLHRLIEDLVFFVHPQSKFKQVTFDIDIPTDSPQVFIDVGQIHQVFLNLFINSADVFAEQDNEAGEISVSSKAIPDKEMVRIICADNGPGIAEDIKSKIFEPHITSKKDGHGFGLWTCKRIINNHGGSLTASNAQDGGAVFEIYLPMARDIDGS